jgi:hypothetical protein
MTPPITVYELPSQESKNQYAVEVISGLIEEFHVDEVCMVHQDQLNFTIKVPETQARKESFRALDGFEVFDSNHSTIKHRYDDKTAVSTNVTHDKNRGLFIISLNY